MRAFAPTVIASLLAVLSTAASEFKTTLVGAGDDSIYLVPSVENGGDLLGDTWRGIAEPDNFSQWSHGQVGIGFDTGNQLPFSEHVLHDVAPEMYQENASLFVRISFELDADALRSFETLLLEMRYDDGFVAWLNGVEVARANAPGTAELTWQSAATEVHPPRDVVQPESFDLFGSLGELRVGTNVLTVHALNRTPGDQGLLMSPELIGIAGRHVLFDATSHCQVLVPSEENGGSELGASWRTFEEDVSHWLVGGLGVGYASNSSDAYHEYIRTDVLQEMRYNTASVFVRVPFQIYDEAQLASFQTLWLQMQFDDGFVVWLNGKEAMRYNTRDDEPLDWRASASTNHADSSAIIPYEFDLSDQLDELRVGENLLAIQGLNSTAGSADMLLVPELFGDTRPRSHFCDGRCLQVVGLEQLPRDSFGYSHVSVTFGVATGRLYQFESSPDLTSWEPEEVILGQPGDHFRRKLTETIRSERTYFRLREVRFVD